MDIYDKAEHLNSKEDFLEFLSMLKDDFVKNKVEWENDTLESFLEGLYGYCYGKKYNNSPADWKVFADILLAAKVFE